MPDEAQVQEWETDKCPHCGVKLGERLVAAIKDPAQDEGCPRNAKWREGQRYKQAMERVLALTLEALENSGQN